MGYTRRWKRPIEIDTERFNRIVNDFILLIAPLEDAHVWLAGDRDTGGPRISKYQIRFNGQSPCMHPPGIFRRDYATFDADDCFEPLWCHGDCTHEDFHFPRCSYEYEDYADEDEQFWTSCKTNRKPYDLAVTSALLIAKRHMGDDIQLSSCEKCWVDARQLCQQELGYGLKLAFAS